MSASALELDDIDPASFDQFDVLASLCRESYADFCYYFWNQVPGSQKVQWNWHMTLLCEELQEAAERVFRNLPRDHDTIFNLPPGTSKSTICSVLFAPWTWTRYPQARHLVATHTDSLALDLGAKSRWVVNSELYRRCFPEIVLRRDQDAKSHFANTAGGARFTCTVGGKTPFGMHAHFIGIDDPIDPKKALSELALENARHFVSEVVPSRKVDKRVTFTYTVMQRLHEQDPTGVQIEASRRQGAAPLRLIRMPAEVEDEPLPVELAMHYKDDLLDPVRLSQAVLDEQYALLGPYGYSGQYRQRPTPRTGGNFEEGYFANRVGAAPHDCTRARVWDLAATKKKRSARTAGVLLGRDRDNRVYVEHAVTGKWTPGERNRVIRATAFRDRLKYGPRHEPTIYIEVEPGSGGITQFQELARLLLGFRVRMCRPVTNKEVRADPWSAYCSTGNLLVVDDGTWDVRDYVKEHCLFPVGQYADQVDASAAGYSLLAGAMRAPDHLRVIRFDRDKRVPLRVVVTTPDSLCELVTDMPALLVYFTEPPPTGAEEVPPHALSNLVSPPLFLRFADIDPGEWQDRWEQPVAGYDRKPADLIMTEEQGRQLWSLLLSRRHTRNPELIVLLDDGSSRAESAAHGICHCLRIPRNLGVYFMDAPDRRLADGESPPNPHVCEVVKVTRNRVLV